MSRTDDFWRAATPGCGVLVPRLRDRGSLTRRIQQCCNVFSAHPVRSGLARIAFDESALLGIVPHLLA